MRRFILVVLTVFIAAPAWATDPNPSPRQRVLIEDIFQTMNLDRMTASVIDSMYKQIEQQLRQDAKARGQDESETADLVSAFRERCAKVDFSALLLEAQIRIYAKYFTEAELTDIAAFYHSPTGKKMISVMPQLLNDGMQAGIEKVSPKLEELMAQAQSDIEHKHPWRRTMSDMRALASAVEEYRADQTDDTYPQALKDVAGSDKLPAKDMWGHAYEYVVSPDRHHYRIVSAGSDGIFEWDSRKIDVRADGSAPPVQYRERLEDDLIYADGAFIQLPTQAKPKTP